MLEFVNLLLFTSLSGIGIISLDSQIKKLWLNESELFKFRQKKKKKVRPGFLASGPKLFLSVGGFHEG